jgi:predicted DNA-binding transcriptional regulator AlpA
MTTPPTSTPDMPKDAKLDLRLIDISELARLTGLSKPTLWRHHEAGLIPAGCKIGRAVRWRLGTGDPATGILDWLAAGCPTRVQSEPSAEVESQPDVT